MSSRNPWFDNAKMALVTLVVVGHAVVLLPDTAFNEHVYDFLYAWHVPAFVLVTGYLSRRFSYTPSNLWKLVRTVAVPYVVFECALALFRVYVGGERLEDLFRDPHWPMWYLSALLVWRLLTPVFKAVPGGPWLALALAVVVSLAAARFAGQTLDLSRALGLLPFFVMGLYATPAAFERVTRVAARGAGVAVLVAIWLLTTYTDRLASTEWLYYRSSYTELGVGDVEGLLTRAAILVVGAVGAWAFLALVPSTPGWFARMGSATLVVYLFHGFVLKGLIYLGYPDWADSEPMTSFVVTMTGAVGLALLLAWGPVSRRLQHLVDPLGYAESWLRHAAELHRAARHVEEGQPRRTPEDGKADRLSVHG